MEQVAEVVGGAAQPGGLLRMDTDPTFQIREHGGVFFLVGELDALAAPSFRRRVTDAMDGTREIVLDLAELSFIDSMGVRTIALLANRLDGCSLVIRYPQDAVTRLLELLEVDEMPGIQIEHGG